MGPSISRLSAVGCRLSAVHVATLSSAKSAGQMLRAEGTLSD